MMRSPGPAAPTLLRGRETPCEGTFPGPPPADWSGKDPLLMSAMDYGKLWYQF